MPKKEDVNSFSFSTTVMLMVFVVFMIASVYQYTNMTADAFLGTVYLCAALLYLGLLLWSFVNPFTPVLIGGIAYFITLAYLYLNFSEGMKFLGNINLWIIIAGFSFIAAAVDGWKKRQRTKV